MPNVDDGQVTKVATGAPEMPRVNLMPPEIAEAARFRRFQLAMGGAVVGAVAVKRKTEGKDKAKREKINFIIADPD